MKLRRVLLALLTAFLAIGAAPSPAYAGGPTSVLMVSPNAELARAAYYTDPLYADLSAAVGESPTGSSGQPPDIASGGGDDVRLTWLIHDVEVWRIDRIHLDTDDGIWIETVVDMSGEGRVFERPAHWHRPVDEAALTAVLSAAGLLGDSGAAPSTNPSAPPAAAAGPGGPTATTPWAGLLAAALAGLALGAAGTLAVGHARRRAPADPTLSG